MCQRLVLDLGVNNNTLLGTVLHPAGNISEFLLSEGLAKVVDWSIGVVTEGRDKYVELEPFGALLLLMLFNT